MKKILLLDDSIYDRQPWKVIYFTEITNIAETICRYINKHLLQSIDPHKVLDPMSMFLLLTL